MQSDVGSVYVLPICGEDGAVGSDVPPPQEQASDAAIKTSAGLVTTN